MNFDWLRRAPLGEQLRAAHVRADLVEAVDKAAFGRPCDGEIAALETLLVDDEIVLQVIEGRRGRKVAGLLALTTERILFTAEGAPPQAALVIERSGVTAASASVHRGLGVVTLTSGSGDLVVDQILGTQAETFAKNVKHGAAPAADPLAELGELRARHQAGDIGDTEFEQRKRELLDLI